MMSKGDTFAFKPRGGKRLRFPNVFLDRSSLQQHNADFHGYFGYSKFGFSQFAVAWAKPQVRWQPVVPRYHTSRGWPNGAIVLPPMPLKSLPLIAMPVEIHMRCIAIRPLIWRCCSRRLVLNKKKTLSVFLVMIHLLCNAQKPNNFKTVWFD